MVDGDAAIKLIPGYVRHSFHDEFPSIKFIVNWYITEFVYVISRCNTTIHSKTGLNVILKNVLCV